MRHAPVQAPSETIGESEDRSRLRSDTLAAFGQIHWLARAHSRIRSRPPRKESCLPVAGRSAWLPARGQHDRLANDRISAAFVSTNRSRCTLAREPPIFTGRVWDADRPTSNWRGCNDQSVRESSPIELAAARSLPSHYGSRLRDGSPHRRGDFPPVFTGPRFGYNRWPILSPTVPGV
jgi:hypothetical protein